MGWEKKARQPEHTWETGQLGARFVLYSSELSPHAVLPVSLLQLKEMARQFFFFLTKNIFFLKSRR